MYNCARLRGSKGKMGGLGGSEWVIGEWSVNQWILGVMRFQQIFGLSGVEHHKVEKWSDQVGSCWVWWVWWVDTGYHKLSENVWFVWSKTLNSGDKWRCNRCGTDGGTNNKGRKCYSDFDL